MFLTNTPNFFGLKLILNKNKTKVNKVYVIGKYIKETFKGLKTIKKGKILSKKISNRVSLACFQKIALQRRLQNLVHCFHRLKLQYVWVME